VTLDNLGNLFNSQGDSSKGRLFGDESQAIFDQLGKGDFAYGPTARKAFCRLVDARVGLLATVDICSDPATSGSLNTGRHLRTYPSSVSA
jgi:hypothetical protein